jgi:hypothetical protein
MEKDVRRRLRRFLAILRQNVGVEAHHLNIQKILIRRLRRFN